MENEHKQITLPHLQNSMLRVKRYVDDQATANVIRTATTLWSGTQTYPGSTNTPVSIVTIDANTNYSTFWGEVVGGVPLSTRADEFDALEVGYWVVNTTGSNKTYTNFYTFTIPVSQLYDPTNNRYRIFYEEAYGVHPADGTNDERVAFSVGLMSTTRLGLRGLLTYPNREIEFNYVKGISYSTEENYSTGEQIVGTWIDGKPLYQRVFQLTSTANAMDSVDVSALNIEELVELRAKVSLTSSSGDYQIIISSNAYGQSAGSQNYVGYLETTKVLYGSCVNNATQKKWDWIIVKYTKASS